MLAMNKKMMAEMKSVNWANLKLSPKLSKLIELGFYELDDCTFCVAFASLATNATVKDFPDKTGYECFVNSIHIDDFVESDYLAHACMFVEGFFNVWRQRKKKQIIRAIISSNKSGAVVKFHVIREGESWTDQDLEKYEDAVLVAESSLIELR